MRGHDAWGRCRACGSPVSRGDRFCQICGVPLTDEPADNHGAIHVYCETCGAPVHDGDVFCEMCGSRIRPEVGARAEAGAPTPADLRTDACASDVTPNGTVIVSMGEGPFAPTDSGGRVVSCVDAYAEDAEREEAPANVLNHLVVLKRDEARTGCTKTINVAGQSLRVKIPAGVNVTTKIDVTDSKVWDAQEGGYRPLRLSFYLVD